jgi:hypothetical protein
MQVPEKNVCLQWVKEAWASVTTAAIIRSFKSAGITTAIDGSEDRLITSLKENLDLAEEVQR